MFSGRHCESCYNGSDTRGGSARRGEDSDLPAGLAAACSQKARFSDSASFAAVLKTAAGRMQRCQCHAITDQASVTAAGAPAEARLHLLSTSMSCLIEQSLPGLWPPADLFNLNFHFIRKVLFIILLPPHSRLSWACSHSVMPLGSLSFSRTHWKLHENHGCWYAHCPTSCSLAHSGHTECTPHDRPALHAPVTGRSEKAG